MAPNHITLLLILLLFVSAIRCKSPSPQTLDDEGYLTIYDNKIHNKVEGSGPLLLFEHGGNLNLSAWDAQISYFVSLGFTVLRISEIGHGASVHGDTIPYGFEIINKLTTKFTDQPIILRGLFWGAML